MKKFFLFLSVIFAALVCCFDAENVPIYANVSNVSVNAYNNGSWQNNGFYMTNIGVSVKNISDSPIENWRVYINLPYGFCIENSWNGVFDSSNSILSVSPMDYNSYIAQNSEQSFGFIVKTKIPIDFNSINAGAEALPKNNNIIDNIDYKDNSVVCPDISPTESAGGVSAHGKLKLDGTNLIDENGEKVVLKGLSSHGIAWFPDFLNLHSIAVTKAYGANVFRVAMYTDEFGGYTTNAQAMEYAESLAFNAMDNAVSLDMYTIIDWHILSDNNPQLHKSDALAFFDKVSAKYAGNPAVIYEICNEPNNVSWKYDIKPYAVEIINVIRKNSPDAVIIVGTNTWSQDVDEASFDLLDFDNIMYAFHFYAGTHTLESFKPKIETALKNGAPVFVSEWGVSAANGNDSLYIDEAQKWLCYLNEKKISWTNWSLCNKNETSSALKINANPIDWNYDDLTDSGKFVFYNLKNLN